MTIPGIVCTLENEGTTKAFAFFPAYLDIQSSLIEVASRTMAEYPSLFVPFIQSSGSEASIVEPEILQEFLDLQPELFFGLGEVGDSPTEPINPPPDSVLYTENFEVAANNGLSVVYFRNGEGHHENLGRALARFPILLSSLMGISSGLTSTTYWTGTPPCTLRSTIFSTSTSLIQVRRQAGVHIVGGAGLGHDA